MEGIASDKVNINVGGGEGGGGGGMAALVAALGNRNQGDNTAALIAALGGRNEGRSDLGALALLSGRDRHDDNGLNALLPILLLGLLGRRGGFGGGDDCGDNGGHDHARTALLQTLLEGQADLRAAVPTVALETQNQICQGLASLALGTQQGFANIKDTVQAAAALNLSATQGVAKDVATGTLTTIINVKDDGEKTRLLLTNFNNEELNRKLTVAQLDGVESRLRHHSDNVEVRVSQNVNQVQAQAQSQRIEDDRFGRLLTAVGIIGNQVQRSRTDNETINFGTMAGSGNQSSQNTQVR